MNLLIEDLALIGVPVVALTAIVVLMAIWTVRAGIVATYVNSDVPKEMLIYTQTAPDMARLAKEIKTVGYLTGERQNLKITIDSTDGYTWPWAWYLRNYKNVSYPDYSKAGQPATPPDSDVVLVNARNNDAVKLRLGQDFTPGRELMFRWWFPEDYRNLTAGAFSDTIVHPSRWRTAVEYFLYRKTPSPITGVKAFVYFKKTLPLSPPM